MSEYRKRVKAKSASGSRWNRDWSWSDVQGYAFAFVAGLGACVLMIGSLTGNLLILACPAMLWLTVALFPSSALGRAHWSGKLVLVIGVWSASVLIWLPKLAHNRISEDSVRALLARAASLARDGEVEAAVYSLNAAEVPTYLPKCRAEKYHNMGVLQLRIGHDEEAYASLQEAVRADPDDVDAYYLLGRIAYRRGRTSEAVHWFRHFKARVRHVRPDVDELLGRLLNTVDHRESSK